MCSNVIFSSLSQLTSQLISEFSPQFSIIMIDMIGHLANRNMKASLTNMGGGESRWKIKGQSAQFAQSLDFILCIIYV